MEEARVLEGSAVHAVVSLPRQLQDISSRDLYLICGQRCCARSNVSATIWATSRPPSRGPCHSNIQYHSSFTPTQPFRGSLAGTKHRKPPRDVGQSCLHFPMPDQWNIQLPPEVGKAANDIPPEASPDFSNNAHAHTSYLSPIFDPSPKPRVTQRKAYGW